MSEHEPKHTQKNLKLSTCAIWIFINVAKNTPLTRNSLHKMQRRIECNWRALVKVPCLCAYVSVRAGIILVDTVIFLSLSSYTDSTTATLIAWEKQNVIFSWRTRARTRLIEHVKQKRTLYTPHPLRPVRTNTRMRSYARGRKETRKMKKRARARRRLERWIRTRVEFVFFVAQRLERWYRV